MSTKNIVRAAEIALAVPTGGGSVVVGETYLHRQNEINDSKTAKSTAALASEEAQTEEEKKRRQALLQSGTGLTYQTEEATGRKTLLGQ